MSWSPPLHAFARRKPPHRIFIANGDDIRTFTVRPWLVMVVGGVFGVLALLYFAATGYLFFRDDLLTASLARQSRMQQAYEDRIAMLRSDIDRLTSRQLLNQEAVEAEVERLLGRQAALDARQDVIAGLSQAARRAGIDAQNLAPEAGGAADGGAAIDPLKTSSIVPAADRLSKLMNVPAAPVVEMRAVENALDTLAVQQVAYVDAVAAGVSERADRITAVLSRLGHKVPGSRIASGEGMGGPFVPLDANADPETFRASVDLVSAEIERLASVRHMAGRLPLVPPLAEVRVTSPFGARMDPFLGEAAVHTGVDLRAGMGAPARAPAAGTVITAEYSGGYGNMVEIDHGNGITTRFGHLSKIDVVAGQVVTAGTIVGRAGSTGRSTGPHLHYEVRIDGQAIDPMRYVKAGAEIAPLL